MTERYLITGVQLGMLKVYMNGDEYGNSFSGDEYGNKIIDNIINNQFVFNSDKSLKEDIKEMKK